MKVLRERLNDRPLALDCVRLTLVLLNLIQLQNQIEWRIERDRIQLQDQRIQHEPIIYGETQRITVQSSLVQS